MKIRQDKTTATLKTLWILWAAVPDTKSVALVRLYRLKEMLDGMPWFSKANTLAQWHNGLPPPTGYSRRLKDKRFVLSPLAGQNYHWRPKADKRRKRLRCRTLPTIAIVRIAHVWQNEAQQYSHTQIWPHMNRNVWFLVPYHRNYCGT